MPSVALSLPCPFCAGKYALMLSPPALLHTIPGCPHFKNTDPEVYLIDAREAEEEIAEAAEHGPQ